MSCLCFILQLFEMSSLMTQHFEFPKDLCCGRGLVNFLCLLSFEHFIFQIYSPSLKCHLVLFDCVDQCVVWRKKHDSEVQWPILFSVSLTTNEIQFVIHFQSSLDQISQGSPQKMFSGYNNYTCNQPNAQKHAVITFSFTGV